MPINLDPLSTNDAVPIGYGDWLEDVKARFARARTRTAVFVNAELVRLYWELGQDLLARQAKLGWGAKVVERLSVDLTTAFPGRAGFSVRNLRYMRAFALAWPDAAFVQEVLAQLPWSHQIALLDRLNEPTDRVWYAQAGIEHGWSRNVLVHQIDTRRHFTCKATSHQLKPLMLNRQFFDEQLDLAQSNRRFTKFPFERALLIHTNLYVEFGMGRNRDPNNPEWRYFIRGLSFATCRKEWGYKYYECCAMSLASLRK